MKPFDGFIETHERRSMRTQFIHDGGQRIEPTLQRHPQFGLVRHEMFEAIGSIQKINPVQFEVHERLTRTRPRQYA